MEPVTVISGKVAYLDRADCDTDQIIPKQFLKRIERTGFGEYLFYDWVRSGEITLEKAPILATGPNFGCGSSREHAVWAIQDFGYQAVVAPSFAEIFYANCTKVGVLPVILAPEEVTAVAHAGEATIDLAEQIVIAEGRSFHFEIDPNVKHRLFHGLDEIGLTLQNESDISAYEETRALPTSATTAL
jgi:3-isopropylmalate/(R)-2-methylmalate dehydratase small subunit